MNALLGLAAIAALIWGGMTLAGRISRVADPQGAAREDARIARLDREAAARRAFLAKDHLAGREHEICREMQREVEAQLKAPATADFPGCALGAASHVTYKGDGHYEFASWVDAENGFGANIRTSFDGEALVSLDGETRSFQITRLTIH